MTDLEKDYRPHDAEQTHLDDDSSTSGLGHNAIDLPSTVPPLEVTVEKQPPAQEPPPNGGLSAWLQVLGSFFLFFNSW